MFKCMTIDTAHIRLSSAEDADAYAATPSALDSCDVSGTNLAMDDFRQPAQCDTVSATVRNVLATLIGHSAYLGLSRDPHQSTYSMPTHSWQDARSAIPRTLIGQRFNKEHHA